jgi:transposase-like protein
MTVKVPAHDDTFCPKCQSANHGTAVSVWKVADERGQHYECDVCGRMWLGENLARLDSKGQPV